MAGNLDVPASVEALYDSRGDEVSLARPLFQGDVLEDVIMSDLGEEARLAMIISHPCSMRAGAKLKDHVTLAAVCIREHPIAFAAWRSRFFNAFPLPGLFETSTDGFPYVDFNLVATVPSTRIDRRRRAACLSEYGVQLLQQRQTFHFTRVEIPLTTFDEHLANLFAEAELNQDWVTDLVDMDQPTEDLLPVVEAADEDFATFMDKEERRERLKTNSLRSAVRQETRREIKRRREEKQLAVKDSLTTESSTES